jgi:O-antigen chain-terminating methyltransferase
VTNDALDYLRDLETGTAGAITAFHVAEHLSPTYLIRLLEECHRVLASAGLLVLETPNPENVLVGACTFYCDPTHRKPLFPPTLQFLLQYHGFADVEIRRLREARAVEDTLEYLDRGRPDAATLNPVIQIVKETLLAAPDFCVIGRKPP